MGINENIPFLHIFRRQAIYCAMMNYIWTALITAALIGGILTGNLENVSSSVLSGAGDAVSLILKILGSICLWNGMLNIMVKSGFDNKINKILSPIIKKLFPNYFKTDAGKSITANITANLLGLGNAATPLGIEAMKRMKKQSGKDTADNEMIRFVIINSAALTLVPTTVAAIRQAAGSEKPMSIIIPVWISGILSLLIGLLVQKLIIGRGKK